MGAVVLNVTVTDPEPVTLGALKPQLLLRGRPVHEAEVKSTVLLYPVWPVMVSMSVPEPPCATATLVLLGAMEKSALTLTVMVEEELPL